MYAAPTCNDPILPLLPSRRERDRYAILLSTLSIWRPLFSGRRVLDFGASYGTSMVALIRLGAKEVVGVEPDASRVDQAPSLIARAAPGAKTCLHHTPDTTALPFSDGEFPFILANAVLEHIPQPRDAFICEMWRLLAPGGHLLINETPNKYFPKEMHTTGLWFNHWLPQSLAYRRALDRGRFNPRRTDWASSGWRGLGYYELVRPLSGYRLVSDQTKLRHHLFQRLGVPSSLLDPYPTWILQKVG